jgi:hypothetical protein
MKNLRGAIVAVAVAGLLGLAAGGCAGTTTDKGGDAKAPADPKAALAASTKELANGNFAFTAAMPDGKAAGAVHLPSKSATFAMETTGQEAMKVEFVLAGPDRWVRMTMDTTELETLLGGNGSGAVPPEVKEALALFSGKTWFHVDATKVKKDSNLDIDLTDPDLTGASGLLQAVTDVQGDAHTITGKVDATKSTATDGFLDSDTVKEMGAGATALPFTATLDDQGRLTELVLDAPKAGDTPAGKWTIDVTGYGQQVAKTKPSGAVTEMPASGYESLNG